MQAVQNVVDRNAILGAYNAGYAEGCDPNMHPEHPHYIRMWEMLASSDQRAAFDDGFNAACADYEVQL